MFFITLCNIRSSIGKLTDSFLTDVDNTSVIMPN